MRFILLLVSMLWIIPNLPAQSFTAKEFYDTALEAVQPEPTYDTIVYTMSVHFPIPDDKYSTLEELKEVQRVEFAKVVGLMEKRVETYKGVSGIEDAWVSSFPVDDEDEVELLKSQIQKSWKNVKFDGEKDYLGPLDLPDSDITVMLLIIDAGKNNADGTYYFNWFKLNLVRKSGQ